jgi:hypothetical protein
VAPQTNHLTLRTGCRIVVKAVTIVIRVRVVVTEALDDRIDK